LAEYDAIVNGRARRKEKARALYEGARLLPPEQSEKRLRRTLEEYRDVESVAARASLQRGRVLERLRRGKEAEQAYRYVIERCAGEARQAVEAYDRLALMLIARGDARAAQAWLRRCVRKYEKRASRGDRYGAFLSRLLGDMKAPRKLMP
jgi:tetratricopeptide (TPR) repeat protein